MSEKRRGKIGSAGRFGARYGRVARRRVNEIEAAMREAEVDGDSVSRIGTGIWRNDRTGEVFTGGSYRPETPGGLQVRRSIRAAMGEEEVEEGDEP
ncbi:MAG: 50S ribosomal protein L37ae [Haloquadratum sp.]|jgi:large subunit ribosomal protein L37Ae|nr:50S ribosomal protein L37ae [Haloferacaceae archaeon]MDR9444548.1 50S ribosomal protein L37ae [Haloquadratum sp.]